MPNPPARLAASLSKFKVRTHWPWLVAGAVLLLSAARALAPLKDLVRRWNDFAFVFAAGRCWLNVVSPYDVPIWKSHWASIYPSFVGLTAGQVHPPNFPFMYPPHWAVLAAPLALLPWPVACRVWDFVNVCALGGIVALLLVLLRNRWRDALANPWLWLLVGIATFNSAMRYTLWDCGLCMVPTLGVVGAFWARERKRTLWLAAFTFLAALKPQISFLPLLYLLLNGGARGVLLGGAAMAVVGLGALLPLDVSLLPSQWRNSYHLHMAIDFNALDNFHSFSSLLAVVGVGQASLLSPLVGVAAIASLTWVRSRVPESERAVVFDSLSELAIVVALEVAFVPLHSYDLVLLTPVFFWVFRSKRWWAIVPLVGLAVLASRSLEWGHKLGFRPLAACFSLATAGLCVLAWYLDRRALLQAPRRA